MAVDNYGASKKPAINVRKYVTTMTIPPASGPLAMREAQAAQAMKDAQLKQRQDVTANAMTQAQQARAANAMPKAQVGPPSPHIAAGPPSPYTGQAPLVQPYQYAHDPAAAGAEILARVAGRAKGAADAAVGQAFEPTDPYAEFQSMVSGGGGSAAAADPGFVDPGFDTSIYDKLRSSVATQGGLNADAIAKAFLDLNSRVDSRKADYQTASDAATNKIGTVGVDTSGFGSLDQIPEAVKAQYMARAAQQAQLQQELGARMGQITQGGLTDLKGIGDLVRQVTEQQLAASTRQQNSSIDQKQAADQQAYNQWLAEQQAAAAAAASGRGAGGGGGSGSGSASFEQQLIQQLVNQQTEGQDMTDQMQQGEDTTFTNPDLWNSLGSNTGWMNKTLNKVRQATGNAPANPYGNFGNLTGSAAQTLLGAQQSGAQPKDLDALARDLGVNMNDYYRFIAVNGGAGAPTTKRTASGSSTSKTTSGTKSTSTSTNKQTTKDKQTLKR